MTESIIQKLRRNGNEKLSISMRNASFDDLSGNDNHGTPSGTKIIKSEHGFSSFFNGIADYINCGTDSSLNFTSSDFTITGWIKPNQWIGEGGVGYSSFVFHKGYYNARGVFCTITNGVMSIATNQSGAIQTTASSAVFQLNDWQQFVITRDGAVCKVYRNGIDVTDSSESHIDPLTDSGQFSIGRNLADSDYAFGGMLDDFRAYDVALTATEVSQLYSETSKLKYSTKTSTTSKFKQA